MTERIEADIVVIGAGAAGLSIAAGASQMGATVVLFEKGEMGGDCLNVGCVPSKALLAAGHAAHDVKQGARFGVDASVDTIDWKRVSAHVKGAIATIAPLDSVERYEGLGVRVVQAAAKFTGPREVTGGGVVVAAKYIVLATGSRPAVPPIPGLAETPYLTNETVFDLPACPAHLVVLGGGPIGCELAQAHVRLGAKVTVIEAQGLLGHEDPEAAEVVRRTLIAEGVEVIEGHKATAVASGPNDGIHVTVAGSEGTRTVAGSHLLVAVGRTVSFDGLDLEAGNVGVGARGALRLDLQLRSTTNSRVFAVGDAAGGMQFTHVAGSHASALIKTILFKLPARAITADQTPRVTYTDPELAQIGPTETILREKRIRFEVLRWGLAENDRAIAEADRDGFVKLLIAPNGRILGATLVGTGMGETLSVLILAMSKKMKVADIAPLVVPYPTRTEIVKRAAGSWYVPKLFSDRTKSIVRFLMRFS
jgi:pyruvate/2-oxoglutarate dehydrogenase complex dihydrolipoamide dehydrogenase (E3) component